MDAFACPHCGHAALPAWKKLVLGWGRRVPCQSCGLRVTVAPLPALAAMLPCLAVVLATALRWLRDPLWLALAGVGAILATAVLHLWAVPLARGQVTDARMVARARGQRP